MFDAISRSDSIAASSTAPATRLQRAQGAVRLSFKRRGDINALDRLYQQGSLKVRLARRAAGTPSEAVLINTAGGITGGDRLHAEITVGAGAHALVTGQAAERVYRSAGGEGRINNHLRLGDAACLEWLPQETILFDGGRLERCLDVELAGSSRFLGVEGLVLGRTFSGEKMRDGYFSDHWRIRRDGRLLFADGLRLDGAVAAVATRRSAFGDCLATGLICLYGIGCEARLPALRNALAPHDCEAGASAWNGLLIARLLARDGQRLRQALLAALAVLRDGALPPRMWLC